MAAPAEPSASPSAALTHPHAHPPAPLELTIPRLAAWLTNSFSRSALEGMVKGTFIRERTAAGRDGQGRNREGRWGIHVTEVCGDGEDAWVGGRVLGACLPACEVLRAAQAAR